MDVTHITFGIKDVVAIVSGVITVVSFVFAIKHNNEKTQTRLEGAEKKIDDTDKYHQRELLDFRKEVDEKFLHAKNAKKANIMAIYEEINRNREDFKEKEGQIYSKIEDIRAEQKVSHDKMSTKLDALATQMSTMNSNLAELTGYIRAKKEDK